MKKDEYTQPTMDVVVLGGEDVVRTSDPTKTGPDTTFPVGDD